MPFSQRMHSFSQSIRFRLVLWFALILALVLSGFSAFIYASQVRDLRADVHERLNHQMMQVAEMLSLSPDETHVAEFTNFANATMPDWFTQANAVLVIVGPGQSVLGSWGPIPAEQAIQLAESNLEADMRQENRPISFSTPSSQGNTSNYAFTIMPIRSDEKTIGFLVYGEPFDPDGELSRLLTTLLLGSLLTLAIALTGGFWLADRAMRPVQAITQAARQISETDLNRRLNLSSGDELGELAQTFDAMLARLQSAFERQRQFLADASHELRTPLTIVNLETSRVLGGHRKPDDYVQALTTIRAENEYMTRMVNDLLTLARMDSGQTVLQHQSLDLSDLAVEAVERLSGLAARNNVTLEIGETPELPVSGDRQYLLQMISNLIENGIKYTEGGDKRVRVETGITPEGRARLTVSDNGPGVPDEHRERLFDRFYRVDAARSRATDESSQQNPGGSGLGLSIVQWIVETHGGSIRLDSAPGNGTSFEIQLPLEN